MKLAILANKCLTTTKNGANSGYIHFLRPRVGHLDEQNQVDEDVQTAGEHSDVHPNY